MPTPILTRKQTPFDGVPVEAFADLAAFVRRWAPRWVTGSRSLSRLTLRRGHQRELARSRRRGYRLVATPAQTSRSARVVRPLGR
ncbi:MAG: hypothetical protein ACK5Y8_09015 [Betaproteobacteria bacterium]|jgi:hypothetical protein|nr:hypothetical protein [Paracoccaceae bacterium]